MPALSRIFHLIMAPIPYRYLIPILNVLVELVKALQAHIINWDIHMFD